jgi:hypothetical protein
MVKTSKAGSSRYDSVEGTFPQCNFLFRGKDGVMYCLYDFEQIQKNSPRTEDSMQGILSRNLDVLHYLVDYKEGHANSI